MSLYRLQIDIESDLLNAKGHRAAMVVLNEETGERHKARNVPDHFKKNHKTSVGGEYGYKARKERYRKRKIKKVGHTIPMVFSGKLESILTQQSKITRTAAKWTFYARGYFPMRVEFRRELEVIAPSEHKQLAGFMEERYPQLARSRRFRHMQRKRIR